MNNRNRRTLAIVVSVILVLAMVLGVAAAGMSAMM